LIDIHHHLIYGVDDGPSNREDAIAMAHEAARSGITHIVCTPHRSDQYAYPVSTIRQNFDDLKQTLLGTIDISLGCELHIDPESIRLAKQTPQTYAMCGKKYLLVELPAQTVTSHMGDALERLADTGCHLILAHPERYPSLYKNPEICARWVRKGCLLQVTASSFFGRFGKTAEAFSHQLLENNWIHFIATDAHNIKWRPPHMQKAYDHIANKMGNDAAERLCVRNPMCVVEGKSLAPQPEPIGLNSKNPFQKKKWLFF
jgi:protein-tyrosine phosphatase